MGPPDLRSEERHPARYCVSRGVETATMRPCCTVSDVWHTHPTMNAHQIPRKYSNTLKAPELHRRDVRDVEGRSAAR